MDPESHANLLVMENVSKKMKFWFRGMFIWLGVGVVVPGGLIGMSIYKMQQIFSAIGMTPGDEKELKALVDRTTPYVMMSQCALLLAIIALLMIVISFVQFMRRRGRLRELGGFRGQQIELRGCRTRPAPGQQGWHGKAAAGLPQSKALRAGERVLDRFCENRHSRSRWWLPPPLLASLPTAPRKNEDPMPLWPNFT